MQSLFQNNSKFHKLKNFIRSPFNILHLPIKYLLLNYQNISMQISPWTTTTKEKTYKYSMTPIPYNCQIFHMNRSHSIFVTMNATIHRSVGHDTMKMLSSLIIKNGTIPLEYHFIVISKLSKLIKRLCKILTIVRILALRPLGILIISNGFTDSLNIG